MNIVLGFLLFYVLFCAVVLSILDHADVEYSTICFVFSLILMFGALVGCILVKFAVNKTIDEVKTTIENNYPNCSLNDDCSFVYNGTKYTYSYGFNPDKITVYKDNTKTPDAIIKDGIKESTSKKEDNTENSLTESTEQIKIDDKSNESSNSDDIIDTIKNKILSKYSDANFTSFDTIKLTGTFISNNITYNFNYTDEILTIEEN